MARLSTQDIRHNATAYWADDAIPMNHRARKDAEADFDEWLAEHDAEVGAQAWDECYRSQTGLLHDPKNPYGGQDAAV